MESDTLKKLMGQREAVNARIRREQGKQRALKRRQDTRRKVLMGAMVLDRCRHDPVFKNTLFGLLDGFLTRAEDRALFGLPLKPVPSK